MHRIYAREEVFAAIGKSTVEKQVFSAKSPTEQAYVRGQEQGW